ncbi:MAG TPA: hypothetical protein DEH02_19885 [Bacteroidales bacterium]|nr:MAG: hypothetical protein A2X01_18620 [Bacteroidetes bacterium GWF2_35_48]OFZ00776.1 MAG: hypothetical protein A2491_07830 [Bacteroidetes bacterium RIFOXYC12_FULL_35_7]HBX53325.1 hypothetical protein [Bacteroidales bacterium]
MSKGGHKKETQKLIPDLKKFWIELSMEDRKKIVNDLSNLQSKRAVPFPHIKDYILCIQLLKGTTIGQENYSDWKKILNNLLKDDKYKIKQIEYFLAFSSNLLAENIIYKFPIFESPNPVIVWKSDKPNYKIKADSKNIMRVVFDEITLICFAKNSSSIIYNTSGIYYPFDRHYRWEGVNGKITWERAGFEKDEMFANLTKYTINAAKAEFEADSVFYFYNKYFKEPLPGKLREKVMADVTKPEKATYPKFNTYTKRFKIPKIYEGVDFDGGFSMEGSKFIGFGTREEPAILSIYKKDSVFLIARSKSFVIKPTLCVGNNTAIAFQMVEDSLYHPSLMFKYFADKKLVQLVRADEGMSKSPFINTYHKIEMGVEVIEWKTDEPRMELKMTRTLSGDYKTFFQSLNLFDLLTWDLLAYNDEVHPCHAVQKFSEKMMSREFYADDFAADYGYSLAQVLQMLLSLSYINLIHYDSDTRLVTCNDRLFEYIESRGKKRDYDVIKINSYVNKMENAKMNLLNFDLKIYGIKQIQLSDSQNVTVFPYPNEILMKKNRYIEFDGRIRAGRFQYYGKNHSFDYDAFKINLTNCDSLHILAQADKVDAMGRPLYVIVRSTVENIRGNLMIDGPFNKSGAKVLPQYPTFNCEKESYVYYDRKSIQGGVYARDKFYFQIFPYSIDSLDNFENKNLKFKGHFSSAGILPEFDETLVLQPDYSLGFTRKSPAEGYPMYGGKGVFKNDINLSNKGLRGSGTFHYITSTTTSDDFIYYPDSMNTIAQHFINTKQGGAPEYPHVESDNAFIHWMPYQDQLFITDRGKPLTIYEKQAYHHGTLKLEPTGLTGWGRIDIESSKLSSKLFYFKENIIDSDTAAFELKSLDLGDLAFKTDNVNAHVDFSERVGRFKSNGDASFVEFPKNQYICFMDQINWYMDKSEIEMSVDSKKGKEQIQDPNADPTQAQDVQIEGPKFISVHPDQDSLWFVSPKARFNLIKSIITAYDVKYIKVADATVYPSEKPVIIEKRAVIKPLEEAKIIANNATRFHTIYNSTVNIFGAKKYSALGDYDYIDETEKKFKIHFSEIKVDTSMQTFAKGRIIEPDNFFLSPNYQYQGLVDLFASKEYLTFTGSVKIKHDCEKIGADWFRFSAEINPNEIYIPVSEDLFSINNNKMIAALMLPVKADSMNIYNAFLTRPKSVSDIPILSANGFLFFDKSDSKYKISNKEKLTEMNMPGNYLHIHRSICNTYGEGKMNFGCEFGQLKLSPIGTITKDYEIGEADLEIVLAMQFYFNETSLKKLTDIITEAEGLKGVDLSSRLYSKAISEMIGVEKSEKWIAQVALGNLKKYPDELEEYIIFPDVKLKWNPSTRSYRTTDLIGIGTIYKKQVNKFVDGYIEIEKKRGGDIFTMYLKVNDYIWFFFTYRSGQMLALSSDGEFNRAITETKKDKLSLDVKKGEAPYRYYIATEGQVKKFLKRMETDTKDVKEEEDEEEEGGKKKKKKSEEDE